MGFGTDASSFLKGAMGGYKFIDDIFEKKRKAEVEQAKMEYEKSINERKMDVLEENAAVTREYNQGLIEVQLQKLKPGLVRGDQLVELVGIPKEKFDIDENGMVQVTPLIKDLVIQKMKSDATKESQYLKFESDQLKGMRSEIKNYQDKVLKLEQEKTKRRKNESEAAYKNRMATVAEREVKVKENKAKGDNFVKPPVSFQNGWRAYNDSKQILNDFMEQLNSNPKIAGTGVEGKAKGLLEKGKSLVGEEDPEYAAYYGLFDKLALSMVKADATGSVSDQERMAIRNTIPTRADNAKVQKAKWKKLMGMLENKGKTMRAEANTNKYKLFEIGEPTNNNEVTIIEKATGISRKTSNPAIIEKARSQPNKFEVK